MPELRTLSIAEAAARAEVPINTFRRRMYALNDIANGRLLVPASRRVSQRVGKWLVVVAVLDEVAPARSRMRAVTLGELDAVKEDVVDAHKRLDVVDVKVQSHGSKLRKHDREFKKHRTALEALKMAQKALITVGEALCEE